MTSLKSLIVVSAMLLVSGCAWMTPMAETTTPDGRVIKAPADTIAQLEYNWSREEQLARLSDLTDKLLARPDSDGNVSAEGEAGHNWKQAMVARDLRGILQDGTNPYDLEIVRTQERHRTRRAAMYVLAPDLLRYALGGEGAVATANGGTYIKQNNTVEGSTMSNSGDLAGGAGAAGAAAGEAAAAAGAPGAPAEGGSRSNSIGGIGNMTNSHDAYNGFQSRFNEILHGEGAIGKQPCYDSQCETHDDDEGSAQLF